MIKIDYNTSLTIIRGDAYTLKFSVCEQDYSSIDLQGYTGKLTVKKNKNDTLANAVFSKDILGVTQGASELITPIGLTLNHTLVNKPVHKKNVRFQLTIGLTALDFKDDGEGNVTSPGNEVTGTIDYQTGEIDLTFSAAVVGDITITYTHFDPNYADKFDFGDGEFLFKILSTDTQSLALQKYFYDVELTSPSGDKTTVVFGDLIVFGDVKTVV